MPDATHTPNRDKPWIRVKDADGHELDRHYQDPGIESGAFTVLDGYEPNDTEQPRPTKYRTTKKAKASGAGPGDDTTSGD